MTEVASFATCLVHGDTLAAKARALLRRWTVFRTASAAAAVEAPKIQEAA